MSIWHEIKKQEDVELSEDGKTIEVLYGFDHNGNKYIEIPVDFVKCVLEGDGYAIEHLINNTYQVVDKIDGTRYYQGTKRDCEVYLKGKRF